MDRYLAGLLVMAAIVFVGVLVAVRQARPTEKKRKAIELGPKVRVIDFSKGARR